jgi:hypothetical protein
MKALTIIPKKEGTLKLREVDEPVLASDDLLCEMLIMEKRRKDQSI